MTDEFFMKRAIALARRGLGRVSPNPLVGAVIVQNEQIIAEGYHEHYGGPHAEINALNKATKPVAGSTIYVNLEPCCHFGKTPPCVTGLIAARPARVVIGALDPNPLVAGRSLKLLKEHGIATTTGVLAKECQILNEVFFKYIRTGLPFVTLKFAQSIDGRIATRQRQSQWISSPAALTFTHQLRSRHDGILVGGGTVREDNPSLTVRLTKGRNPLRIAVDSTLSIEPEARIFKDQGKTPTIMATTAQADPDKIKTLRGLGVEILTLPTDEHGKVDLYELLASLGGRGVSSLLVEGGSKIITSFLAAGLVDRMVVSIAPKILGKGVEAVGDLGINHLDESIKFSSFKSYRRGDDLIIDGRIEEASGRS